MGFELLRLSDKMSKVNILGWERNELGTERGTGAPCGGIARWHVISGVGGGPSEALRGAARGA